MICKVILNDISNNHYSVVGLTEEDISDLAKYKYGKIKCQNDSDLKNIINRLRVVEVEINENTTT